MDATSKKKKMKKMIDVIVQLNNHHQIPFYINYFLFTQTKDTSMSIYI